MSPRLRRRRPLRTFCSIAEPRALGRLLAQHYPRHMGSDVEVCLFSAGTQDTYRIVSKGCRYYFRLYRRGGQGHQAITAELRYTRMLRRRGLPVAAPLLSARRRLAMQVPLPEGVRFGALFPEAAGGPVRLLSPDQALDLGVLLARLHECGRRADSESGELLLSCREFSAAETLNAWPSDWHGPRSEGARAALAAWHGQGMRALATGACHGDFHLVNLHWYGNGWTVIDFERAARAPLVLDLATFLWSLLRISNYPESRALALFRLFLEGYSLTRPLTPDEHNALPFFVCLCEVRSYQLFLRLREVWGRQHIEADDLEDRYSFLDRWVARLDGAPDRCSELPAGAGLP